MYEYRVMELVTKVKDKPIDYMPFYPHGYSGTNSKKAFADLREKRNTYEKYGRKFILERREVGAWKVHDPK